MRNAECGVRNEEELQASVRIAKSMAVVVLLPAEPVTAMSGAAQRSTKRFISLVHGMPRATAAWKNSERSFGTAGLTTSRSQPSSSAGSWPPSAYRTPGRSTATIDAVSSDSGARSVTVTAAP